MGMKLANRLYDLVEAGRRDRGLSVEPADVFRGGSNLLMFEEPSFCLARDTGAYAYNLHFRDDGHGVDILLLFQFASIAGGPKVNVANSAPVTEEEVRRAEQFLE